MPLGGREVPAVIRLMGSCEPAPGEDWIPCRVAWEKQRPMVDWCYLGGVRFNEPFFQDSIVRALRRPFSAAFLRRTPLEAWDADAWPDPGGVDLPHVALWFHLAFANAKGAPRRDSVFRSPAGGTASCAPPNSALM